MISVADHDAFLSRAGELLSSFINTDPSARPDWVRDRFGDDYPAEWDAREVLEDVLTVELRERSRSMAACPKCDRLILQLRPGENVYRSHKPEPSPD
ncbi:MAG: hypothetical protein ACYTGX_06835 [Planctomycetota bacterium]